MSSVKHIVVAVVLSGSVVSAQPAPAEADSSATRMPGRSYTLPEYVVSATRWQVSARDLPSSATVLTAVDLAARNGSTLADVLEGVPGLFLKSYGGPGSVSTTSLRGMGAEHTLVLVDGQRYNNIRDGQVDFGIFMLQNVERIEVLRGGYSSIYGADALGGIINIVTRRTEARSRVSGEVERGSFGSNAQTLRAEFTIADVGLQIAARRQSGDGDFEFDYDDGVVSGLLRRQNADYSISQLQWGLDMPLSTNLTARLLSTYDWADRGSPGPVLAVSASNKARLRDGDFLNQMMVDWAPQPGLMLRLSSQYNASHRQYIDPSLAGETDDQQTEFADRTITLTPHMRYILSTRATLSAGVEYSRSSISGKQLSGVDREQQSAFLSGDYSLERSGEVLHQVNIYPSIRYDRFSDVAGSLNPKIGINIGLWQPIDLRIKSTYGKSFRAPTFYDLYWKTGGNPRLKPEHSISFDAGIALATEFVGPLALEATYFDIRTDDRIVWTPDRGGLWSPKNLQSVRSKGLELTASWILLDRHLVLRGCYSSSDARNVGAGTAGDQTAGKRLPFIPQEMASVSAALNIGPACINVSHDFTGYRFASEANELFAVLPEYQKTDANISIRILENPVASTARLEISNIFNTRYSVFPNFPMPLRSMTFKLRFEY